MKYEIIGGNLPVVEVALDANESMICEAGAMSWMSNHLTMSTSGGGLGKMFSKAFSGESMFRNTYTAEGKPGMIAFASSVPGSIVAVELNNNAIIAQKGAFLAATSGIDTQIAFQSKAKTGIFGGEGFIMQKIFGTGTVFLEIDGSTVIKELAAGEKITVDTGYVAYMSETCKMEAVGVAGMKNKLLGGEGLFNTVITGPGKVALQTMPISQLAGRIAAFIPTSGS